MNPNTRPNLPEAIATTPQKNRRCFSPPWPRFVHNCHNSSNIEAPRLLEYIGQVRDATGQHVTPMDLVGRAAGKILEALPGLNGRVVFGSFLPSPTIDCSFVVSLRTDSVTGVQAASTDASSTVVRRINEKPPWVIAKELTDRASCIRHGEDPQFKQMKTMVKVLPPLLLRAVMDGIGFVTESLQLPLPFFGVEARPFGSILVSNVGTYGLDVGRRPGTDFLPRAVGDHNGCGDRQGVGAGWSTRRVSGAAADDRPGSPVRRRLPGGDDGPHLPRIPG